MLIGRGAQASGSTVLGTVVVDLARCSQALGCKSVLGHAQALAHAVHAALVGALGSKSLLRALGARKAVLAHTSAVGAATIATALAITRACLGQTAASGEASLTHAGPILCDTVGTTHRGLAVHASPPSGALASALHARAVCTAHLWPAGRLAAVCSAEALGTFAFASNAFTIAAAVLGAL